MAGKNDGKNYEVVRLRELSRLSDTGRAERFFRVEAKTAKGTVFTLDIPDDQIDVESSGPLLDAKAKQLDALLA